VNQEEKVAYIQSQIVCANCELEVLKIGLVAARGISDNDLLVELTKGIDSVPKKFGLTSNQILAFLTGV